MENSLFGGRTLVGSLVSEKVISSLPSTHIVVLVNGGDRVMVMEFHFHCFYIIIFGIFSKSSETSTANDYNCSPAPIIDFLRDSLICSIYLPPCSMVHFFMIKVRQFDTRTCTT